MSDVIISYRPIKMLPFRRSIKRQMPDGYSELNSDQFIVVANFFEKKKPLIEDKIFLIKSFLGLRRKLFFRLEDFQVHQLLPYLDWIENVGFDKVFISLLPAGKKMLHGPKDGFQDVSFDEFAHADTYFARYHHSKDEADLRMMVASLYRPIIADRSYTSRGMFSEGKVEHWAEDLRKADPIILTAVEFNYKVIRKWFETLYPLVFPAGETRKNKSKEEEKFVSPGWSKVRRAMTSGDLASVEKIGQLPVHTVLAEMNDRIKDKHKRS